MSKIKRQRSSHEDGRRIIACIAAASLIIFLGSTVYFSLVGETSAATGYAYAGPSADLTPIEWKAFPPGVKGHFTLVNEEDCSELSNYIAVSTTDTDPKYETFRIPLKDVPSGKTIKSVDIVICAKTNSAEGPSILYVSNRFDGGDWASAKPIRLTSPTFGYVTASIAANFRKLDTSTMDVRLGSIGTAGVTVSSIRARIGY